MGNGRIYALFLIHLNGCGGCTGKRSHRRCDYAIVCAVVETLAKNGAISNPKEMFLDA
jgi:hypothetical protein